MAASYGRGARYGIWSMIRLLLLGGVFVALACFLLSFGRRNGDRGRQLSLPIEEPGFLTRRERREAARAARKLASVSPGRFHGRVLSLSLVALALMVGGIAMNGGLTSGEPTDFERAQTKLVMATHPPGSITIIKEVPDTNAQTFGFTGTGDGISPSTFTLADDGAGGAEQQQQFTLLTANGIISRNISEDTPLAFGWSITSIICSSSIDTTSVKYQPSNLSSYQSGDTGVTIILREDEDVSCTFNNSQAAKPFLVYKDFSDNNGTINVTMSLQCGANPGDAIEASSDTTANDGNTPDPADFSVTGYTGDVVCTATETEPSGYTAVSTTCQANLSAGQCTITNNLNSATFTVNKTYSPVESVQTPNPGSVNVSLTCNAGNVVTTNPQPADDPTPDATFTITGIEGSTTCTATEAVPNGYSSNQATTCLNVAVGENQQNAGCTITNTANPGTLIVVKNTGSASDNDTFGFTGTGSGVSASFNITTATGTGNQPFNSIAVGAKSVTEGTPPANWTFGTVSCTTTTPGSNLSSFSYSSQTANVTLGAGDTVTCTFTNTKQNNDTNAAIAKCGDQSGYDLPVIFVAANTNYTDNSSNDIIVGGGNNTIDAGSGKNCIIDLSGTNFLTAGSGVDIFISGGGVDTINAGAGANKVESGGGGDDITTGDDADIICTGTFGTFGDINTCSGAPQKDIVKAGGGHNTVKAGNGNNEVTTGNQQDEIWTGTGADIIKAGGGDNTVESGGGGDNITSDNGDDLICTSTFGTFGNIDTCAGSPDNDTIDAGGGLNKVKAGDGTNNVKGAGGVDQIWTGNGDDTIDAGDGANIIQSGNGTDNITTGGGADKICAGTFTTFGDMTTCTGGTGNKTVTSGNSNDTIRTGSGNDVIDCGAGAADVANVGTGTNTNVGAPARCETFAP